MTRLAKNNFKANKDISSEEMIAARAERSYLANDSKNFHHPKECIGK